jgi:hypothetical protein
MANINWGRVGRQLLGAVVRAVSTKSSPKPAGKTQSRPQSQQQDASPGQYGSGATREIRADAVRGVTTSYAPDRDGAPDPGEVVWTWVPYVENDGRGKDRPVLILARLDAT